jgi:hypothetical protein
MTRIKSSKRVYRLLISAIGVSFDGPTSSSPPADGGGTEHREVVRPPVGWTPNLAYGVPNSNSTLPTWSRRQGDSDLLTKAVENGNQVARDDGAARLMSGDSEGALRWSSDSGNGFSSGGGDRWSSS